MHALPRAPAPALARPLWERPWPRCCHGTPPPPIQVAIASKLAPTNAGSDRGQRVFVWEWPWPRYGRRGPQASMRVVVGVRRPLPQGLESGSAGGSGAFLVGAALAATGPSRSAGLNAGCRRDQKTPLTEPRRGLGSRSGAFLVGAALAATGGVGRRSRRPAPCCAQMLRPNSGAMSLSQPSTRSAVSSGWMSWSMARPTNLSSMTDCDSVKS
jgi:hypothetical protein